MPPWWFVLGMVVAVGIGFGILFMFYRKLSAIERHRKERSDDS